MVWLANKILFVVFLLVISHMNVVYAADEYCVSYTINSVPQVDCRSTQAACEALRVALEGNSNITNLSTCYPQGSNPCVEAGNQCVQAQYCNNLTTIGGCGTGAVCCDMREPGRVELVQAHQTVPETAGSVTFQMQRTGGDAPVTVEYEVVAGTVSGSVTNFGLRSGTLSWGTGDMSVKAFSISVIDDNEAADPDVATIVVHPGIGDPGVGGSGSLTVTDNERDGAIACIDAGFSCKPPGACKTAALSDAPACTGASGDVCCAETYEGDACTFNEREGVCTVAGSCGGVEGDSASCGSGGVYACCVAADTENPVEESLSPLGNIPDTEDNGGLVRCGDNIVVQYGTNAQGKLVYRYVGECTVCDFQKTLMYVLNFLVATMVAVAALLFVNAGFYYLTAQGSAAKVSKAHRLFVNTLTGLVLVLAAYLLVDVFMKTLVKDEGNVNGYGPWNEILCINPTNWYEVEQLDTTTLSAAEYELQEIGGGSDLYGERQTVLEEQDVPETGYCSEQYLATFFPASELTTAACVCWHESNGVASIPSGVDKCLPSGEPASWGLFQINLTAHPINGLDCPSAISGGAYSASNKSCAVESDTQSQILWENCKNNAVNPTVNIQKAVEIQQRDGWGEWGAYHRYCK